MLIKHLTIKLRTEDFCHFVDLTDQIEKFVTDSKIKDGLVLVYSKHTTVAIRVNERERGLVNDFRATMKRLIPKEDYYHHNDTNIRTENLVCEPGATDCLNGHSHCIHLLMGNSETIPLIGGKLVLGTWQRIFAIELDVARNRTIFIQVMGE